MLKSRENKMIYFFLIAAAIGLSIKYIFVDLGIDAEYQVAMGYRLALGDIMFKEMWEAHQTSAFLCAFFIKIYLFLFKTTTGIVLYLQVIGVLIDGAISYLLYRTVSMLQNSKRVAFAMAWVFFVVSPKDVPIAEFANMQVWFCMLLCLLMFIYYQTTQKRYLVLAALSLCAAVLSYPSCAILLAGVGFLFFRYGKKKDFFLFTGICAITGIIYLCFILKDTSFTELLFSLEHMLSIEPTHTVSLGGKFLAYGKDALKFAGVLFIIYIIAFGITMICKRTNATYKDKGAVLTDILFYTLSLLLCFYMVICWQTYTRCYYSLVFITIILIGLHHAKRLSGEKLYLYICGTTISVLNFFATILLTDLDLITSVPYLLIALVMAFLPITEVLAELKEKNLLSTLIRLALIGGIVFLTFRNAYIIRPMNGHMQTIMDIGGIVKGGPAVGIVSEYMGTYMQNESLKEWEQYIEEDSYIYIIGSNIDTLGYLYADTNVAAPSVMSTPGYNDSISKYWEMNPDKYPDIVIASCWYGNLDAGLTQNQWMMNWIEEEFKPQYYIDGKYWRYYFRNAPK
ncbi:MAG: hypothetical protein IJ379_12105 [Lachnospiraceae bacterium]|nr:hypothetical protein [Lachnospiraceae bacterium]